MVEGGRTKASGLSGRLDWIPLPSLRASKLPVPSVPERVREERGRERSPRKAQNLPPPRLALGLNLLTTTTLRRIGQRPISSSFPPCLLIPIHNIPATDFIPFQPLPPLLMLLSYASRALRSSSSVSTVRVPHRMLAISRPAQSEIPFDNIIDTADSPEANVSVGQLTRAGLELGSLTIVPGGLIFLGGKALLWDVHAPGPSRLLDGG
jgi:hypothetical protein